MGIVVPIYTYRNQLYRGTPVSFYKKGIKTDAGISIGSEPNQKVLPIARGSVLTKERGLDITFIDYGFLFKSFGGERCLISLSEDQAGKKFDYALVVFRKPDYFDGELILDLEDSEPIDLIMTGHRGNFKETIVLLPAFKKLRVTTISDSTNLTLVFYFDGKSLRTLNWFERLKARIWGIFK